ncbi:hypothetical protein CTRI78_v004567 [Colletotrichum trifolii]|uniref:DUF7908 domain-containing protein n=1 Tax=Colletotrichum trifolii TaxID=5466 RepID=A0A4R8RGX0_COLTR|nr:hypothetical protein CTRI78_v004567 [Colletotrichum trifolii]
MLRTSQIVALAATSFVALSDAAILRDNSHVDGREIAWDGAPQPSIPALRRRQDAGGFLGTTPASPVTGSCTQATTFSLNSAGQLEVDGAIISVNPGTPFMPLRPIIPLGSITVTFSLNNGALTWSNDQFFGGQAGFCQDAAGQVYATFADPAVAYPAGCTAIQLGPVVASTCQSGSIVSSLAPSTASTASAASTARTATVGTTIVSTRSDDSVFSTVSSFETTLTGPITEVPTLAPTSTAVVNGTLTLRSGLYPEPGFFTPAGQTCSVVTESWIYGDTTLLPARSTATTAVV